MANMQVILREDVPNLGKSGEVVSVKQGYGRNYLLPRELAIAATSRNVARLEHEKRIIERRAAKLRSDAESMAAKLRDVEIRIERQVGAEDKLFGSVSARDVVEALAAKGFSIDHRKVQMPEGQPVRTIGVHMVDVKLDRGVVGQVKLLVMGKPA